MTDSQLEQYTEWIDHSVIDQAGDKVGKVSQVYVDDHTGELSWVAVNTGMFARRSSLVPVAGARADGDQMVVAWDRAKVRDAPQVDDDGDGYVSPEEEEELYRYYDFGLQARESDGRDTSGPTTDGAMTRSEEKVNVGTRTAETGRARLRKYVVTEQVTQTVPVSHEEVRIEREPITGANRDSATAGPAISEEVHEVTLHQEVPVVEKEVVPVERVRLTTDTVTGEETINEEVRREEIKAEGANQGRESDQ